MRARYLSFFGLFVALTGVACDPGAPHAADTSVSGLGTVQPPVSSTGDWAAALVDPRVPRAIAGDKQWKYVQRARADFDGDGQDETAVLITDVSLDARGAPLWEDGHSWQLYIEEADSTRTYVYARFLPNGSLEGSVTLPDAEKRATLVLREMTPHAVAFYEVRYSGPQRARTLRHLQRELDPGKGFTTGC